MPTCNAEWNYGVRYSFVKREKGFSSSPCSSLPGIMKNSTEIKPYILFQQQEMLGAENGAFKYICVERVSCECNTHFHSCRRERLVRHRNSFSSSLRQNRQIIRSWSSCKFASFWIYATLKLAQLWGVGWTGWPLKYLPTELFWICHCNSALSSPKDMYGGSGLLPEHVLLTIPCWGKGPICSWGFQTFLGSSLCSR